MGVNPRTTGGGRYMQSIETCSSERINMFSRAFCGTQDEIAQELEAWKQEHVGKVKDLIVSDLVLCFGATYAIVIEFRYA